MPPCQNGSQATVPAISPLRMASTASWMPSMPVTGTLPARPSARSASTAASAMSSLAAQMPPILSPNWVSQALVFSSASVADQLATWMSSSLTSGIGLERLLEAGLALDRRHVRFDAAQRHDAALAAHRLDQRFGHGLAVGHAAEGDVGDVVRVEVPGMQVVGLVPLGDDIGAGCLGRPRRSGGRPGCRWGRR